MYAALFEMKSWMGLQQYIFKGKSASALLNAFEDVQDLSCLVMMGRAEEDAEGQKMLDKLEEIINKRAARKLKIEDLLSLDIKISIGAFKCVEIAEGDNAVAELKEKYPKALSR